MQVSGLLVGGVHANCAAAGELADRANNDSAAAQPSADVDAKKVDLSIVHCRARALALHTIVDSAERELRLRTLAPFAQ